MGAGQMTALEIALVVLALVFAFGTTLGRLIVMALARFWRPLTSRSRPVESSHEGAPDQIETSLPEAWPPQEEPDDRPWWHESG